MGLHRLSPIGSQRYLRCTTVWGAAELRLLPTYRPDCIQATPHCGKCPGRSTTTSEPPGILHCAVQDFHVTSTPQSKCRHDPKGVMEEAGGHTLGNTTLDFRARHFICLVYFKSLSCDRYFPEIRFRATIKNSSTLSPKAR